MLPQFKGPKGCPKKWRILRILRIDKIRCFLTHFSMFSKTLGLCNWCKHTIKERRHRSDLHHQIGLFNLRLLSIHPWPKCCFKKFDSVVIFASITLAAMIAFFSAAVFAMYAALLVSSQASPRLKRRNNDSTLTIACILYEISNDTNS